MRGFRVYDKQERRMITEPTSEGLVLAGNGNLVFYDDFARYLGDRYIRMDDTTLTDKEHNPIYEGDIIDSGKSTAQVIYGTYGFTIMPNLTNQRSEVVLHNLCAGFKVIGNIYQHKELLNKYS